MTRPAADAFNLVRRRGSEVVDVVEHLGRDSIGTCGWRCDPVDPDPVLEIDRLSFRRLGDDTDLMAAPSERGCEVTEKTRDATGHVGHIAARDERQLPTG